MTPYVAFIRAINVAGHASVRMSDVRDAFVAAGCKDVRTYIQSGNVMFAFPQQLGVMATSRNWSTVTKIVGFVRRTPAG